VILVQRVEFSLNPHLKVGVIVVLLLILVLGPLLQIYDCFNDAPNLDQDALLHTIDALLSFALILALEITIVWILAIFRASRDSLKRLQCCRFIAFFAEPIPSISPHSLSLRI
jgi:hypothetical protein